MVSIWTAMLGFSLSFASVVTPANSAEEVWWDRIDGKWCMRTLDRTTCMPKVLDLERISDTRLRFADHSAKYRSFLLFFETHQADVLPHKKIVKEAFDLFSESIVNDLQISEYRVNRAKEPKLRMSLFVVAVDPTHEIVLQGRERSEVVEVVNTIVKQWKVVE